MYYLLSFIVAVLAVLLGRVDAPWNPIPLKFRSQVEIWGLVLFFLLVGAHILLSRKHDRDAQRESAMSGELKSNAKFVLVGGFLWRFTSPEGVVFTDAGEPVLQVRNDGKLLVSTVIRDEQGNVVAKMIDNKWDVSPPPFTLDRNYTDRALEVRNPRDEVVLQVVAIDDVISIQAVFHNHNGIAFGCTALPNSMKGKSGTAFTKWDPATRTRPLVSIEPVCMSGRSHFGECPHLSRIESYIESAKNQQIEFILSEPIELGRASQVKSDSTSSRPKFVNMEVQWEPERGVPRLEPFFVPPGRPEVIKEVAIGLKGILEKKGKNVGGIVLGPMPYAVAMRNTGIEPAIRVTALVFDPDAGGYYQPLYNVREIPVGGEGKFGFENKVLSREEAMAYLRELDPEVGFVDLILQERNNPHVMAFYHNLEGFPFLSYTDFEKTEDGYRIGLTTIAVHGIRDDADSD